MITKDDFKPEHKHGDCIAEGCPMLGTMQHNAGSPDWLCPMHFARASGGWRQITSELHRLGWLVQALRDIRQKSVLPDEWPSVFKAVQRNLAVNERTDLQWQKGEPARLWAGRLETELTVACNALNLPKRPVQAGFKHVSDICEEEFAE